ncbi:MAG: hypothetical protein H6706_19545 [Myxococcales bacterium]|nr:hypothetical protein [Myxococcales bacterium]
MNRRDFVRRVGTGAMAASALLAGAAGAAGLRRAVVAGQAVAPLGAGWLALDAAAGRVTAYDAAGGVRWTRAGLGLPRAAVAWGDAVAVSDAQGVLHLLAARDGADQARLVGFAQPWGVAVVDGDLWVADRLAHEVVAVTRAGARRVVASGLNAPAGMAAAGRGAWVADGGNARLVRLAASGEITKEIKHLEDWRPRDVAVEGDRVVAASAIPAAVWTFDRQGRLVDEWRPDGLPQAVAVTDRLVVGVA